MSKKCKWVVRFWDGTVATVDASCKRMARANASGQTGQLPSQITGHTKQRGAHPRNGNRPMGSNRSRLRRERREYNAPPPNTPTNVWSYV